MSTDKIAIDTVLIPPDDVLQLAIDINKTFSNTAAESYVLDLKTCIPHITLLMGLIMRDQLSEVCHKLDSIAKKSPPLNLQITGTHISTRPDGKVLSTLVIENTVELQKLHEAILNEMSSIFTYEGVQKEMFYSPPPVNEIPLFWVKGFAETSVRENYKPHITLGVGEPKQAVSPVQFTASKLALCHLGNHCTCRDLLWSASLT
jgi:2'-5' RNA ligase